MTPELKPIAERIEHLYRDIIDPVGERFAFPRAPHAGEVGGPPMVLIIGNHSSGKSSFINHLLGKPVQTTGLAPTDDAFTVLAYGEPGERDGRAIVSDPDLAFTGLAHFGPTFLSHFRRKTRPIELLRTVHLVDTPGMIDSAREDSGRGYDFTGAVRWFAERAELVLMFFDPDKPGTTGETLEVFNSALGDLSHKLRVVMNKVDMFRSIEDFARAYAALCWNLAKVMPRKDLPLIYTTYTPMSELPIGTLPRDDFDRARVTLIEEIRETPERRADTMITRLSEHADRLELHARIVDAAVSDARASRRGAYGWVALAALLAFGGAASTLFFGEIDYSRVALAFAMAAALTGLALILAQRAIKKSVEHILADLDALFRRLYGRELLVREHAADLRALWDETRGRTARTLENLGPLSFPRLGRREHKKLHAVRDAEVPSLRRMLRQAREAAPEDAADKKARRKR
ncbi:MAG: dynamin family protein [bacterium]